MNQTTQTVSESELHAYCDGLLDSPRHAEVEAWLAANPTEAQRVEAYRRQNAALHALFDVVLDEPLPPRLRQPDRPRRLTRLPLHYAAALAWLTIGGVAGWLLHGTPQPETAITLARQAAVAYAVYTPEVRHPVEVGAGQEAHLVAWLSKRLGTPLKIPHLGDAGFELVGGRLLPAGNGPAAQFMYQDSRGRRLTLYLRGDSGGKRETAFRFVRENGIGVFYWVDGSLGYALSGELEKPELLKVAEAVYRQLNP